LQLGDKNSYDSDTILTMRTKLTR